MMNMHLKHKELVDYAYRFSFHQSRNIESQGSLLFTRNNLEIILLRKLIRHFKESV